MQKIFSVPSVLEKSVKEKYSVPDFLMMENAALALKNFILQRAKEKTLKYPSVFILCGKGNNGGDGYALARLIFTQCEITILNSKTPTAPEALKQYEIYSKMGKVLSELPESPESFFDSHNFDFIIDCLYGTGFHGELNSDEKSLLDKLNSLSCEKIACDIPSALYFKADFTLTMGCLKTQLYSDCAKAVCGKIIPVEIGFPRSVFEAELENDAFLVENSDAKLPFRNNPAAHKGTYGHTIVFACDKAGAAILCGTAALNFGSGLTSIFKLKHSDLDQFKISPELMLCDSIPAKASCLIMGPGVVSPKDEDNQLFMEWFKNTEKPSLVLDAGIFNNENFIQNLQILDNLNKGPVVLTPHLSELNRLLQKFIKQFPDSGLTEQDINVKNLSQSAELKLKVGKIFADYFPNVTLVMKSANTFIFCENQAFIVTEGGPSLAKGGSGDILAGMTGALLSQGYSGKDAAITACQCHAKISSDFGNNAFDLTPSRLIEALKYLK